MSDDGIDHRGNVFGFDVILLEIQCDGGQTKVVTDQPASDKRCIVYRRDQRFNLFGLDRISLDRWVDVDPSIAGLLINDCLCKGARCDAFDTIGVGFSVEMSGETVNVLEDLGLPNIVGLNQNESDVLGVPVNVDEFVEDGFLFFEGGVKVLRGKVRLQITKLVRE